MIYFTSDTHFDHKNIIRFCDRPYENVEEMNEDLIKKWNSRVRENDVVYHMGDVSMSSTRRATNILRRLNGTIRLLRGNHDKSIKNQALEMFDWVKDYYELSFSGTKIVLCHYAFQVWNGSHRGSWHLHGHSHGTLPVTNAKRMDVGVDTNDMYPWSIDEIAKIMQKRSVVPFDQHVSKK